MVKKIEYKTGKEIIKDSARNNVEILDPVQQASPFFSFRYSYKEISSDGGRTRIRSKEKSFENGKFKSEEFEGTLPGNIYFNMVGEMQKMFFNQFSTLMKPFSLLLPFGSKDRQS
ncbi:MAG TPA: hypothetical protein PLG94_16190 [Smithellaceae bacterium]|jgi:hypothetical protein|nr:hypothetical protein [Smithellaceae bacterium]